MVFISKAVNKALDEAPGGCRPEMGERRATSAPMCGIARKCWVRQESDASSAYWATLLETQCTSIQPHAAKLGLTFRHYHEVIRVNGYSIHPINMNTVRLVHSDPGSWKLCIM